MTNNDEINYLSVLNHIMENGNTRQTRNAIVKSSFAATLNFDLKNKFPLLTTKTNISSLIITVVSTIHVDSLILV